MSEFNVCQESLDTDTSTTDSEPSGFVDKSHRIQNENTILSIEDDENSYHGSREDGEITNVNNSLIELPKEAKILIAGKYKFKIGTLHIIDCVKNQSILDIDTILFLEDRKIQDIYGAVADPKYSVSNLLYPSKEIEAGVSIFYTIYYAGNTKFVDIPSAMNIKGTDASGIYDEEIPHHLQEFSDDEHERSLKKIKQKNKSNVKIQPNYSNPQRVMNYNQPVMYGAYSQQNFNHFNNNQAIFNPHAFPHTQTNYHPNRFEFPGQNYNYLNSTNYSPYPYPPHTAEAVKSNI
ncbi:hypothetical protein HZS_1006 [Henneguya salminicola]|nr:hypothetical protein HZS_1006 [Henneguya salminicola]